MTGGPTRESAEFFVRAFLQGLNSRGWFEGQNIVIEWRFTGGMAERLRDLAVELFDLHVDLIVVPSTAPAFAASNVQRLIDLGAVPVGSSPQKLAALQRAVQDKWGKVIERARIKLD